jgi:bifunctional ADP-heptose synthase (sugar kinase/adenylyltransferase)
LDTRTKIVSLAEARRAAAQRKARWFTGYFDPLVAEHLQMLRNAAKQDELLIVQIMDPPRPLLPARARAELVAGLDRVDYVVEPAANEEISPAPDDDIRRHFIDNVRRRASDGARA